jgi:hypothetical protein
MQALVSATQTNPALFGDCFIRLVRRGYFLCREKPGARPASRRDSMDVVADGGLSIDIIGRSAWWWCKAPVAQFSRQGIILGWVCNHGCLGDIGRLHSR